MLKITAIIHSDLKGNYKTKDVISQLIKANLGIELPDDKPCLIDTICLANLRYKGLPCTYGITEGIIWDNNLCIYTERKITLYFG